MFKRRRRQQKSKISNGILRIQNKILRYLKIVGFFSTRKTFLSFSSEPVRSLMYSTFKFGQNSIMTEIRTKFKPSKARDSKDFPNTWRSGATPPSKVISVSFGNHKRDPKIFNLRRILIDLKHKRSLSFNPLVRWIETWFTEWHNDSANWRLSLL